MNFQTPVGLAKDLKEAPWLFISEV